MRNLEKIAAAGEKRIKANERRNLTALDVAELVEAAKLPATEELLDMIRTIYSAGFEEGYRERQSRETRKKVAINV